MIIACDFFDPPHVYVERRGNLILRILPPGETTIGGIEFTMLKNNVFDPEVFGGGLYRSLGCYRRLVTGEKYVGLTH